MAKETMIGVINKLISKRLKSLAMTDVIVGTIASVSPITITILDGLDSIPIPEELIDIDSIPEDAKVGDTYKFLRYKDGSRFYALNTGGTSSGDIDISNLKPLTNIDLDKILK